MQNIKGFFAGFYEELTSMPWLTRPVAVLILLLPVALIIGRAAGDIVLSLTAVLFLISALKNKEWARFGQKWFIAGLCTWAYFMCSALFAEDVGVALGRAAPWIRFLVFALAIQTTFQKHSGLLKYFIVALSGVLGFVMFDALNQYFTGTGIFGHKMNGVRLTAPFNDMIVGIYLSALSPPLSALALHVLFQKQPVYSGEIIRRKLLAAVFLILTCATILFSGERMALALHMFGLGIMGIFYIRNWYIVGGAALLGLGSAGALFMAYKPLFNRYFEQTVAEVQKGQDSIFYLMYSSALRMFIDHPVFGIGLKNYRVLKGDYLEGSPQMVEHAMLVATHPHNYYLEFLAETGLVGTALILSIMVFWARSLWANAFWKQSPVLFGAFIAVFLKLWPLATTGSFFSNWNASIFWFLFGLSLIAVSVPQKHKAA